MGRIALSALLLSACASRASCPAGDLSLPAARPAFALVRSDFASSSAIALLAADGSLLDADLVDSGTRVSTLVTSVAGDAVVPSTPLGTGVIAWLDRLNVDELTLVAGGVATEIDVRGESVGTPHTGFSANPQDAILLADGRVLVSRLGVNLDASAPELQRGNDVVVIDHGALTQRIDLRADATLDGCTHDCTAYALPSAMLRLSAGDHHAVLVVLERLGAHFTLPAAGAVVVIDETTLAVSAPLDLSPLEDCQFASVDPGDPARAYVACTAIQTLSADRRAPNAGVAEITMDASGAITMTGLAQASGSDPVVGNGVIAIGGRRVLAVAHDAHPGDTAHPDHLLEIDVASGSARDVYQTTMGFELGVGALAGDVALVPDAEASAVVRIDVSGVATMRDRVAIDDCVSLPPVQIAPLAF